MFPNRAPANSIYNVHNESLKTCGEIVAVSLVNGGPAPSRMAESVFELMLNPEVDLSDLSEEHFTSGDMDIFKQITLVNFITLSVKIKYGRKFHLSELSLSLLINSSLIQNSSLYLSVYFFF